MIVCPLGQYVSARGERNYGHFLERVHFLQTAMREEKKNSLVHSAVFIVNKIKTGGETMD